MQKRLLEFKHRNHINKCNGPFYMVSFDIANCFDSIPHDRLKLMLEKLLKDKFFSVKRIDVLSLDSINDRPKRIISRAAQLLQDSTSNQCLTRHSQAVVVDRVVGKVFDGHHILATLIDHIFNNTVQVTFIILFLLIV